jgi:hypothetical protein
VTDSKTTTAKAGTFEIRLDPYQSLCEIRSEKRHLRFRAEAAFETPQGPARASLFSGSSAEQREDGLEIRGRNDLLQWSILLEPFQDDLLEMRTTFQARGPGKVRLLSHDPMILNLEESWLGEGDLDKLCKWTQPFDVWGRPGQFSLGQPVPPKFDPYWQGAVFDPHSAEALCFGFRQNCQWADRVDFEEARLRLSSRIDVPLQAPLQSDRLLLCLDLPVTQAMLRIKPTYQLRVPAEKTAEHFGWNSWDYYRLEVTAQDVLENVEFLASDPELRRKIRYIIVDDGWETMVGDWDVSDRFGMAMAELAERIRQAGFVPGLWSAPFLANRHSRLLKNRPDLAVQCSGEPYSAWSLTGCAPPWGDRCQLDPTRQEVVEHIEKTYRKFREWGYGYFKTDFLSNCVKPAFGVGQDVPGRRLELEFHDRDQGLLCAHRRCMRAIRDAIGPESFWTGCGTLYATGAGLMDASRISADIHVYWKELLRCAGSVLFNYHLQGRLWLSDPDFAVFRGRDTVKPGMMDWHNHARDDEEVFGLDEARLWATCLILSGGLIVLGDRLESLNDRGMEIVRKVLTLAGGRAGVPLDPESAMPGLVCKRQGGMILLGLLNWQDSPRPLGQALAQRGEDLPARMEEVWTGRTIDRDALGRLEVPARGAVLLVGEAAASGG